MFDASCINATSTSVSLLYSERPVLNFAAYVSRMEQALRGCFEDTLQLSWDHDDVVVIDIDGSRVLLGYWEAPQAATVPFRAALVLSVGPGPDWRSQTRLARNRKALCQSVIAGILDRNPADMVLWKDFQGVFTTEDFDMLVDQAAAMTEDDADDLSASVPAAAPAEGETAAASLPGIAPGSAPESDDAEPGDERFGTLPVRRLMDRLETEIRPTRPRVEAQTDDPAQPARRRSRRPDWKAEWEQAVGALPMPATAAPLLPDGIAEHFDRAAELADDRIANDMPDLPPLQATELDRIRHALYPEDAPGDTPPLSQRLTIYAVNTTLMLVALPVGAALMTYNILGGEDLKTTARAAALTGAAIGFAQTMLGHYVLSMV